VVNFLLVIIADMSLALTADAHVGRNQPLLKEVGHYGAKY